MAWWIGGLPGDVTAHVGQYTVETSTPAAVLVLFLIALFFDRSAAGDRRYPPRAGGLRAWRGGGGRGRASLRRNAGSWRWRQEMPRRRKAEAGRARKLLGDTPLVLLLSAESARLAGQAEQAQAAF